MQNVRNQVGELRGFITERHFDEAEQEFPGITRFYYFRVPRPPTFLDLLVAFITADHPDGDVRARRPHAP